MDTWIGRNLKYAGLNYTIGLTNYFTGQLMFYQQNVRILYLQKTSNVIKKNLHPKHNMVVEVEIFLEINLKRKLIK